ncbi:hypothetical protein [Vibrio harveyi]|uniref:hypothetical protein n=1 Tax=Vibrio harveyi TaxID=669 RepID=UPI00035D62E4|nr:hypothetical protein [Vibrio harveyi]EKO3803457.1 hypothetical protein [Vibrio harveyi]EKO3808715.1 hypothetical protein [Vibrio harveyi]ELY1985479.1 hypothetical protein [Vibrio harveyi]EMD1176666.1 hypothetical protein [Vibrio harveyi]HDM8146939.1 hypothetical protein [Vibrio harveyi]
MLLIIEKPVGKNIANKSCDVRKIQALLMFSIVKRTYLLPILMCIVFLIPSSAYAELPASLSSVSKYRINEQLVRIAIHNMEINPLIEVDTIDTPSYRLNDSKKINSILLDKEVLAFSDSAGVFVEDYGKRGTKLFFVLDYFYLQSGSVLVDCEVSFNKGKIMQPECSVKEYEEVE